MMVVVADGKKTLLVRAGGRFYATAARCPHWGAPLADGLLHGPRVLCPWHKSIFDVRDGALLEPPALDGLRAFRVRVDGDDVYVDRDAAPEDAAPAAGESAADGRLFAVVGGGAAAAAGAEALREAGFGGRIVMISAEDRWPYDRPNLSKDFLTGELEAKWLPLRAASFYEEHGIERLHARVSELDVRTRAVMMENGQTLLPDAVLIASGARPRRLNVPGVDLDGVCMLRSWDDAETLAAAAQTARRAVVIGASFIGMEVAAALVTRGLEVTVVGIEAVPFERILGAAVGAVVQAAHEARGTRFALGRGVSQLAGEARVESVVLDDGTVLEADLVVVGAGVEPVTDFVRGADVDRDGGLSVDEQLRLAQGVWAAGDVARYRDPHSGSDVRIEHWRLAEQHGRAAARSMVGRAAPFTGVPFFWTQHFDLRIGYAGAGQGWEDVVVCGDLAAREFTAFYVAGEQVLAAAGTQDDELGAFMELVRLGAVPAAAELRGGGAAGLPGRLATLA
jgi:NADPH-dependent 2,4-dienoyl-CoA reductase/sulfur reductase-like enzyme/nitrite reductase/ring-hydroxylating ferredoxin subunit